MTVNKLQVIRINISQLKLKNLNCQKEKYHYFSMAYTMYSKFDV